MKIVTHYDAIVVGAGSAGASAALHMAANGLHVALLERGDYPGSKNMFGGVVYTDPTAEIVPGFLQEAPLERVITRDNLWMLDKDSAVEIGFTGLRFANSPTNKISALRPLFDRWLADKAVQAGAILQTQAVVSDVLREKKTLGRGAVNGVILEDGSKIQADVVVIAEGVRASLAKKTGMGKKVKTKDLSLWIREVISLPAEKIEDRFLLEKNEGAVLAIIGYPTTQIVGLAGVVTNRDSIALSLGMSLNKIVDSRVNLPDLLTRLKEHPYVRRLVQGGKPEGYSAHMIPMGGPALMPRFYDDGIMITGDAAIMISGRRGSDLAMLTGKMAADTAVQARAKQDFSAGMLKNYEGKLKNSFFMKNIQGAADRLSYFNNYGDSDYLVNTTANEMAYEFFRVGTETDDEKIKKMVSIVKDNQSPAKTLTDFLAGMRNWGVL